MEHKDKRQKCAQRRSCVSFQEERDAKYQLSASDSSSSRALASAQAPPHKKVLVKPSTGFPIHLSALVLFVPLFVRGRHATTQGRSTTCPGRNSHSAMWGLKRNSSLGGRHLYLLRHPVPGFVCSNNVVEVYLVWKKMGHVPIMKPSPHMTSATGNGSCRMECSRLAWPHWEPVSKEYGEMNISAIPQPKQLLISICQKLVHNFLEPQINVIA